MADVQAKSTESKNTIKDLLEINKYDVKTVTVVPPKQLSLFAEKTSREIIFEQSKAAGYASRTAMNASADATIAIAVDFDSAGEKLTRKSAIEQGKKWIGIKLPEYKSLEFSAINDKNPMIVGAVKNLNEVNATSLNIAGNGIYTFAQKVKDIDQPYLDDLVYRILSAILNHPDLTAKIESIRTGGQTGIDEAGAKAGIRLGIPTTVLAPKGWTFRDITGKDISNETAFKQRFATTTPSTSITQEVVDKVNEVHGTSYTVEQFQALPIEEQEKTLECLGVDGVSPKSKPAPKTNVKLPSDSKILSSNSPTAAKVKKGAIENKLNTINKTIGKIWKP